MNQIKKPVYVEEDLWSIFGNGPEDSDSLRGEIYLDTEDGVSTVIYGDLEYQRWLKEETGLDESKQSDYAENNREERNEVLGNPNRYIKISCSDAELRHYANEGEMRDWRRSIVNCRIRYAKQIAESRGFKLITYPHGQWGTA